MTVVITDHALLRYLDRVMGIDVESIRADMAAQVETAVAKRLCYYDDGNGLIWAIAGRHVKTVMTKQAAT